MSANDVMLSFIKLEGVNERLLSFHDFLAQQRYISTLYVLQIEPTMAVCSVLLCRRLHLEKVVSFQKSDTASWNKNIEAQWYKDNLQTWSLFNVIINQEIAEGISRED